MRNPILSLLMLCALVSLQPIFAQELIECPDAPPTRLADFDDAVVTPGQSNHLRDEPSLDGEIIGELPAGTIINILNTHECADGYLWWAVAYNGIRGYTAEGDAEGYWLEPYLEPTPMPVSTATDTEISVQSDLLTFRYSPELAGEVTMQPRTGYMLRDAMSPHPHYVSYRFDGYITGEPEFEYSLRAEIELYPVRQWEVIYDAPIERMTRLRDMLDTRPALPTADMEAMPYLPYRNAAQIFAAQIQYLDFENGAGVRYLTYYAQDVVEITSAYYTFQGVTDDGAYYISAAFPVIMPESASVPFDQEAAYATSMEDGPVNDYYREYVARMTASVNALAPSEFTPDLTMLDALIESMHVNTEVEIFPGSE